MRLATACFSRVLRACHARAHPVAFPRFRPGSATPRFSRSPIRTSSASKTECAHSRASAGHRPGSFLCTRPLSMQDYPVDEDAVHRGDDDRIAPAVESAVAMGFLREDATQAAKRVITEFPGRQNVEELVVDALLRNAHGGARAFALPKTMPTKYADNALLRETKGLAASENENEATLNSGDGAIDLTESPEAKPPKKRKTHEREAVDTNEGNANKTPVIALEDAETDQTKPSETDQTKRVSATLGGNGNDLMRQLAAERRARDTARGGAEREPGKFAATPRSTNREPSLFGGGASGSGAGGSGSGLTGAAARAALGAAASRGAGNVAFGGSGAIDSVLANDTGVDTSEPLPFIKVLTYNVWFAEHVALADRVQGLSDVVRESDPHVLCLQEVTPNTLMLLHAQSWFETYKCTPPPTQPYFTLVLFKRHLQAANKTTRLVRRVFPNSRMGRYADGVSGLHCGGGVELCVMSSHLESFIGKDDTSSGERVAQMQDVFRTLDGIVERRVNDRKKASGDVFPTGVQNALFAGDTNWDEKSDGEVPLDRKNGWVDAWCEKGDGGPGYTYDLRRNQMMSGWLQKRLDRVFCRLESFEIETIEIVGTTPVLRKDGSTATHVNEWKGKRTTKPVLPSDHFGVLVTLKAK